ncbi:MAG: hypothetical protein HQ567_05670 [Candidatus Nealsonbacteria bacterium]|nr:hypothetical protein [Candidatus Nealsonbacteria bacterium]
MVITAVLVIILFVLGALVLNKATSEFGGTLAAILFGAAASLLAWLVIEVVQQLLLGNSEMAPKIDEMLALLEQMCCLQLKSREQIKEADYYESAYKDARHIKCSGRAMTDVISDVFGNKKGKNALRTRLREGDVTLQILLLSPCADLTHTGAEDRDREVIMKNLGQIWEFCIKSEEKHSSPNKKEQGMTWLGKNSSIEVRVTTWPLNSTLFCCANRGSDADMLIGRLYNGVVGSESEAYMLRESDSIPNSKWVWRNNLKNFDATWEAATVIVRISRLGETGKMHLTPLPAMKTDLDVCKDHKRGGEIAISW